MEEKKDETNSIEHWLQEKEFPENVIQDITTKLQKQGFSTKKDLIEDLPTAEQLERWQIPGRWASRILRAISPQAQDCLQIYNNLPDSEQEIVIGRIRTLNSTSTYLAVFTKLLKDHSINFHWKPDYEPVNFDVILPQNYPPKKIPAKELEATNVCWFLFETVAKKLSNKVIKGPQDLSKMKRIVDLVLVKDDDATNFSIQNSLSAIEFKKVGQLEFSTRSSDRDYLFNEAASGIGQLLDYCKCLHLRTKQNSVDCALSDFKKIMFIKCNFQEKLHVNISNRYDLSYQDGKASLGLRWLVRMWAFVIKAQATPVKTHLGTDLPPCGIVLENLETYVLTHLICKTSFWITCAYQLPTFQTVVIKIGWLTEKALLEHEANILQQLVGIEGVQQLVAFGRIVGSDSYWALVTVPLGIPLSILYRSPITKELATNIIFKVSEILHRIHQQKIIHRDIKPSNIIMVNEKPVIIDFGCAIVGDESGADEPWAGTVEYAPVLTSNGKTYPSYDYESLVYTAIQLTRWLLPWSRYDEDMEKIKKEKTKEIVSAFPSQFISFVHNFTSIEPINTCGWSE